MVFNKKIKKCRICKKPVKEEFHFCPYCGEYLRAKEDFFDELDKMIEQEFEKLEKLFGFAVPRIKIFPKKTHEPEIESEKNVEENIRKVEEPKIEEVEKNGEKIIKIKLPGVKEENNVEIKRLEESIEIRAKCGDKIYFKIIPIHPKRIYKADFKNEEIVLVTR